MPPLLKKIISDGQTGADMGGLLAARELGIETGDIAPKGWLTENGPKEVLLRSFGLSECEKEGFPARTQRNVADSSGTLLVSEYETNRSRLTFEVATQLSKPLFLVAFGKFGNVQDFRRWLEEHQIQVLNVAGNRESQSPGIAEFTRQFLLLIPSS